MIEALQIAQSGLKATQEWLDVISNNIANTQTAGYKKSSVSFSNMVKPTLSGVQASDASANSESSGIGTQIVANSTNFASGAMQPTGQALDIAVNGPGFIEVLLDDGSYGYTRSGQLKIDSDGQLITASGHQLSDNIVLSPDMTNLTINSNGTVEVIMNDAEVVEVGQIKIAMFASSDALTSIGNGMYIANDRNDIASMEDAGTNGSGTILQGFVEGSNVELIEEMTSLVLAQRAYQLNARLVQVMDSIMETTNNIRR